jgi:hypothetical protein
MPDGIGLICGLVWLTAEDGENPGSCVLWVILVEAVGLLARSA